MAALEIKTITGGDCNQGYGRGAVLGSGQQGTAYRVATNINGSNANERLVMKISELKQQRKRGVVIKTKEQVIQEWKDEAQISYILGNAGIGPKIYKAWLCKTGSRTDGYIVMEKMKFALRGYEGAYEEIAGADVDHLNAIPERIQKDYVKKLESMINMGYIHFDNHPGNLGITERDGVETGILFDFGFTKHRPDITSNAAKLYALGFSIAQIIEHMPRAERLTNYLFKIFVAIEQGIYVWGSQNYGAASVASFVDKYTPDDATAEHLEAVKAEAAGRPAGVPKDIYVGFKLYCHLLMIEPGQMYTREQNYGEVYAVRQSLANRVGGKRRTQRRRANRRKQTRRR